MQFTKLRLLGFKSFVDPVELSILSGLTGIVGPNGCGKSNLLEALRWGMGENRPSSMRSGAMDDVIFAGTGTRVAKNFAEVLISLNAVDQVPVGLDMQTGSIEVVRRVTRDIGSSYRLNGKDVRAKDISMLFADSSTGAHSPSIVRQGQIAELINANPKSRRRLLEEAAGISGLYQRRHEAELKLKSSESNMARLEDVIEQLENQIKMLAKQAKQAIKYESLAQDIRSNEAFLFCKKWFESEQKLLLESDALVEKTKLLASVELELISLTAKREKEEEELPELRRQEINAAAVRQRLIVEKEGIENEQKRAENIIVELKIRAEEIDSDYVRQNNLIIDAKEVIERVKWELMQLEKLSEDQDQSIEITEKEASAASKKLVEDELKLDNHAEDYARLSARFQNIEKQIDKAKHNLEKIVFNLDNSDKNALNLVADLEEKQAELSEGTTYFKKCKEEARIAENSLESIEKLRVEAIEEEFNKRVNFSSSEGKLAALQSEANAIRGLISSSTGQSRQILDEVSIAKDYEMAFGAAFSDDLKAPIILLNDKSGWFQLPDFEENMVLPDGVVAIADKVTAPDVMKRRLSNIGVVDPSDGPRLQKLLKPGQKLVSKDGSLWRWDGYCCIEEENFSQTAVRLKQENRLTDLLGEIEETKKKVDVFKAELELAQRKSAESEKAGKLARNARSDSDEKQSEASRMVSKVEFDVSILTSKLHNLRENSSLIKKDQKELEFEIVELNKVFKSLGDLGSKKHLVELQRSVVEQSRDWMVEKRSLFDNARRDADIRSKRRAELDLDLKNWEQRLTLANETIIELGTRKISVDNELNEAEKQPESLVNRRESLVELLKAAEQKKDETSENLSKKESNLRLCIGEERDLTRRVSGFREDIARTTAIKENVESNLNELRQAIREETANEPEALIASLSLSLEQLPEVFHIESKLVALKNSRDALGAVNLRAAEDSKELTSEWENLTSEKIDLETAIKKLRSAIIKLNSEGRSRLLEAFQEVNKNFGELFENLFGGGNAKLSFIESDDPLDAGLEIICQPPGKKLSTLSLLSGGEQTLTAIALIFAVFKANPSPICVLDEVDAPLDDANVERFCGLLDEMTRTTQTRFMIITHHPLTMSRMDRLYGVTMVERGVSQLVSVDLNKAEQLLDF